MQPADPGLTRASRSLGAAVGAAGALAAGYGAVWSGHAESIWLVAAVAGLLGAVLGGLTWGVFEADSVAPAWWFTALFGGAVGMLAGAFAGFPLGAVFGAGGGAVGGVCAVVAWQVSTPPRTHWDVGMRGMVAAGVGIAVGFVTALGMAA